jgi:Helix-turn-helix domain
MALSLFTTIPSILVTNKNIEAKATLLFGVIGGLCNNDYGYCWASNEYFAEMFDVDTRTVQRWLKTLKDEKIIKIEVGKDGIKTSRKIWICLDFSKIYSRRQNCHGRHDKSVAEGTPSPYIYNKKDMNIDIAQQAAPAVANAPASSSSFSSKRKKIPEEKSEVAPGVFLNPTQKAQLLKKLDGNEDKLNKCLTKLSDWKIGQSIQGGNDYMSICKWVIGAVKSEEVQVSQKQAFAENRSRSDQIIAEKIWNKCKGRRENDIVISAKYIEFIQGVNAPSIVIEFGSKDFLERCKEQLRKRKIEIEGI